ncbi:MAG: GGDEF domain-containing protein [Pseudomonadota bacterium]
MTTEKSNGAGDPVPAVDPWGLIGLRERILGSDLEEILADLKAHQFAMFPPEAQAYMLRTKRMEMVRARILEAVSDMPVFEPLGIVERIRDFLPDAFGSEVVNFSEYIGDAHVCFRRNSDASLREGKQFRNKFGEFSHPVFMQAAVDQAVICAEVEEDARRKDRYRTASFMVVPVVVQVRTFGVFSFADKGDKAAEALYGRLDQEEIGRFARTFGNTLTDKVEKAHDGLTALLNRTHFVQALDVLLAVALRDDRPISVVYADLDHFKQVNDVHGHAVGDVVLQELAEIMRNAVRYTGPDKDLVARMGGEEFALALPIGEEQSVARAHVIHRKIREHSFPTVGHLTASIGIRSWSARDGAISVDEILRQADEAMYHRKQNGRDGVTRYEDIA